MVLINYAGREINAKIVYYGPGLSGKTTNLECIYASVPKDSRGKMVSMKTRQDRTLFFDFLPLELGEVHGFRTRFLLYTVPGQVFYNATRKLVLKGVDAVVFVADSTAGRIEQNLESLNNLRQNLEEHNLSLDSIPWVMQYNKRDLPKVHSIEELEQALNPQGVPYFEAAAATGRGVYETLHAVSSALFQRLVQELRPNAPQVGPAATPAPATAPVTTPVTPSGAPAPATRQAAVAPRPVPRPVAAPAAAPQPNTLDLPEVGVDTVAPNRDSEVVANATAKRFGVPAGNVPAEPTSEQILSSLGSATSSEVEAPTQEEPALEIEMEKDFGEFGHTVDLALEPQGSDVGTEPGFIKDPLQKPQATAPAGGEAVPAGGQPKTLHIPVTLSSNDLAPGTTLRLILDVRIDR
jgi:signal recognition particle receptor subunit beta